MFRRVIAAVVAATDKLREQSTSPDLLLQIGLSKLTGRPEDLDGIPVGNSDGPRYDTSRVVVYGGYVPENIFTRGFIITVKYFGIGLFAIWIIAAIGAANMADAYRAETLGL
jgi:hypothetical protein